MSEQIYAAALAADYIHAWCRQQWPEDKRLAHHKDSAQMASTVANGEMIDVFDHQGGGSHKYIPAAKLTEDLGEPQGAGVFGYWKMYDGSYLLRTCNGRLAHWSGKAEDKAEWGN